MNTDYFKIISASQTERRDLFLAAAQRLGTSLDNVEKDFWVFWMLDVMSNGLGPGGPRLLFKGGTSLSKAFGLTSRFSEDIDITVFRDDLGQAASIEDLESLSGRKRRLRLESIKAACQHYITEVLLPVLSQIVGRHLVNAEPAEMLAVDEEDPDRQSLLFRYPNVSVEPEGYVRRTVKIEAGARSALDPNLAVTVKPYVAQELESLRLDVPNITTVVPSRTFWDKVIILHGQRRWFERRGVLRHQGQRVSRHYYDVHQMMNSDLKDEAIGNRELAIDCARHARMFFNSADLDLGTAMPGTLALVPAGRMLEDLRRDYARMGGMIIDGIPQFEDALASISELEARVNNLD